jgi:putative transposase
MADATFALARVRRTRGVDLLPDSTILQLLSLLNVRWRERLLPPVVTVRLFLLQILFGNTSIAHVRQLSGIGFAPSSYSDARQRLPLQLLRCILRWTLSAAALSAAREMDRVDRFNRSDRGQNRLLPGTRVIVVDCTSFSMPDTPVLRKHFGLPMNGGRTQPGVSYPVAKVMALLDLATGCFTRLLPGPLYRHEARGVVRLHRQLRAGDVLLGDRAFCTYVQIALLSLRGVHVCFRLHQRRKGVRRGIDRWRRPQIPPPWMNDDQFATLPESLDVRIVRYTLARRGYRTTRVAIATTLLDEQRWPDAAIIELYGHRWTIETCFDHLKTTMNMNVLKCKTTGGVQRELMMYLIAYNLIRLAMLDFALKHHVSVHRVSFIDAMRYLATQSLPRHPGVAQLIINPHPPDRPEQPRAIRRRHKNYPLLTQPRNIKITQQNAA